MSDVTQRDAFFDRLYELAREDVNIVIVAADMSAPALDKFRRDLPAQFVNVGIAEQNAIVIASGLALTGKKVFAYAIAPFITLRCLEQIRVANAIMHIPITIVGMGTGLSYDSDGPTHHLIEDVAVLRAFANIEIHSITDAVMAAAYADISCTKKKANYIRLDKDFYPVIYDGGFDFSHGLARLREGKDNIIIATGPMVHVANAIAGSPGFEGLDIGVVDVFEIPINESTLLETIDGVKKIITLEEHFLPGGLGSAICEILNDNEMPVPVKRLGLDINAGYQHCYKYGGRELIRRCHGIDRRSLEQAISEYFCAQPQSVTI
ncbi:MAG: hypothetical protein JSW66_01720 [Phycisphaerales bacterium]|nr:MAG: hypothetical protein JSW66_01720 [Phycisphaerales bacterium]